MRGRAGPWWVGLAVLGWTGISAAEELRPGVALSRQLLSPEAAHYEDLLQQRGDSVDKRRHFDAHRLYLGVGLGGTILSSLVTVSLEANPWDRLALGVEGGVSAWGTSISPYARLRPIVWSGQQHRALNAVTVMVGYRYMAYGDVPLAGVVSAACHGSDCDRPYYLNHMAHFLGWELGTEHAFWKGWSLRWGIGAQHLLVEPDWQCAVAHQPAKCTEEKPISTIPVGSFVLSHTL